MENEGKIIVTLYLGNDCFEDHPEMEIHRLLSVAAVTALELPYLEGVKLLDVNGNIVGEINHVG